MSGHGELLPMETAAQRWARLPVSAKLEWRLVRAVDRLPWFVARAVLRFVDFRDGTWALGFKKSKRMWLVS